MAGGITGTGASCNHAGSRLSNCTDRLLHQLLYSWEGYSSPQVANVRACQILFHASTPEIACAFHDDSVYRLVVILKNRPCLLNEPGCHSLSWNSWAFRVTATHSLAFLSRLRNCGHIPELSLLLRASRKSSTPIGGWSLSGLDSFNG